MEIGSLIRLALGGESERMLRHGLNLQLGDRLDLRVLEVRADQRALVDFGGFRVLAEVGFPVAAGQRLSVEVLATEGQLRLGVVRPKAGQGGASPAEPVRAWSAETLARVRQDLTQTVEALDRLPTAKALHIEIRQALLGLGAALASMPIEEGPAAVTARVEALIAESGLFFEKRLADELARLPAAGAGLEAREIAALPAVRRILGTDLKVLLAEVRHLIDRGDSPLAGLKEGAALARSVEALMSEIGRGQETAGRRQAEPEPFQMIHFTLPLGDERHRAALKIGFRKPAGSGSRDGSRAALLLELDRLGTTRVDLFALDQSLAVTFFVNTPAACHAVEAQAAGLKTTLASQFADVRVEVHVSRKKIAQFETEDILPADGRRLDVHV